MNFRPIVNFAELHLSIKIFFILHHAKPVLPFHMIIPNIYYVIKLICSFKKLKPNSWSYIWNYLKRKTKAAELRLMPKRVQSQKKQNSYDNTIKIFKIEVALNFWHYTFCYVLNFVFSYFYDEAVFLNLNCSLVKFLRIKIKLCPVKKKIDAFCPVLFLLALWLINEEIE